MATKPVKFTVPAVMSMTEVSKLKQSDAVKLFEEKSTVQARVFMELAKIIVHLKTTLRSSQTIYGVLGKSGIKQSSIANAMQAARVWDEYVKPGLCTESWFDGLSYSECVAINGVGKARGTTFVVENTMAEIEHVAEHGMTVEEAEEKKRADAKALADAAARKAVDDLAKANKVATASAPPARPVVVPVAVTPPAPVIVAPSPVVTAPVIMATAPPAVVPLVAISLNTPPTDKPKIIQILPKGKATLTDGLRLIEGLEEVFTELNEEETLALAAKLFELSDMVVEAESKIRGARAMAA